MQADVLVIETAPDLDPVLHLLDPDPLEPDGPFSTDHAYLKQVVDQLGTLNDPGVIRLVVPLEVPAPVPGSRKASRGLRRVHLSQ